MRRSITGNFARVAAMALALGGWQGAKARAQGDDPAAGAREENAPREGIEGGAFDDYAKAEEKRKTKLQAEYGVGLRFRTVYVPKPIFELFVEEASSGLVQLGYGLELSRRKDKLELVLGFEYENLSPDDGFWLEKGDDPNVDGQTPDFIEFDGLSWISTDFSFIYNAPLGRRVSFRYGAGLGIGVVLGDILQTDTTCAAGTDDITEDCVPDQAAMEGRQLDDPADLPPVFPVVQLLVGLQWRPIDKLSINLETGIRTVGFAGLSSTYYF